MSAAMQLDLWGDVEAAEWAADTARAVDLDAITTELDAREEVST